MCVDMGGGVSHFRERWVHWGVHEKGVHKKGGSQKGGFT